MEEQKRIFVDGLIFKEKNPKLPDFFKGHLSIKVNEFKKFLDEHQDNGWVNINLKESKGGKYYTELNTYKKNESQSKTERDNIPEMEEEINIDDIPF